MKKKSLLLSLLATLILTVTTIAQTVPSYVPTDGLVGYWPFNGNANDESGNALHCTIFGNVSPTDDRFGNPNSAYLWPSNGASSNYMFLPNFTSFLTNSYSMSFWIFMDGGSINPRVLSKGEWVIGTNGTSNTSRTMNFSGGYVGNLGQLNVGPIDALEWVHVVWTADGSSTSGESQVYINGVLYSTQCCHDGDIYPNWTSVNPSDFNIGRKSISSFDGWGGKIDDIGIWSRILTLEEVVNLYNGCSLEVNVQPSSQTVDINDNAQFIVGSSDLNATYQWQTDLGVGFQDMTNAGQYSGVTSDTLSISNVNLGNNNQQFRCIISLGSCSDTSEVAVLTVNTLGINEFGQDNLFSVYPNPAQSIINVKANVKTFGKAYAIYDNRGRVIITGKIKSEYTIIDLGNLSGGLYFFSVGENMKQTFKIIKSE